MGRNLGLGSPYFPFEERRRLASLKGSERGRSAGEEFRAECSHTAYCVRRRQAGGELLPGFN